MFKLYKDKSEIKNVKLNINTKKMLNTAKITIFASTLALALISINNNKKEIHEMQIEHTVIGNAPINYEEKTLTYKDYITNKYMEKAEKYSHLLCLDEEICKNEINKKLKNESNESLKNNFSILEDEKYSDSIDIQTILFLKDIRDNSEKYGYTDIKKDYTIESDLTIREMVNEYSEAFGVDPNLALAISCGESGWYEQDIATVNNNPFSYRLSSGSFAKFPSLERGIMEGILNLRINYYDYGLNTFDSIQQKYCTEGGEHWLTLVKGTYKDLENGKKLYDEKNLSLVYKEEY